MLTIKIQVDAQEWEAQGIKEALGMYLERWGRARVVEITVDKPQQIRMGDGSQRKSRPGWGG